MQNSEFLSKVIKEATEKRPVGLFIGIDFKKDLEPSYKNFSPSHWLFRGMKFIFNLFGFKLMAKTFDYIFISMIDLPLSDRTEDFVEDFAEFVRRESGGTYMLDQTLEDKPQEVRLIFKHIHGGTRLKSLKDLLESVQAAERAYVKPY